MVETNFDALAEHFSDKIYNSQKGEVRLAIVKDEMLRALPVLRQQQPLTVLDIGGGLGQITLFLAEMGHNIVYCDASEEMLKRVEQKLAVLPEKVRSRVKLHHCDLDNLAVRMTDTFNIVVFHAVLEWLEEPRVGLQAVLPFIKPGGFLSLLFYNRLSLIFRNLIRGNFRKVESGEYAGEPGGLTPTNPLDPAEVEEWLQQENLALVSKRGVRCFYDYMEKELERSTEDIVRLETQYGVVEPYRSLGRYMLFHVHRPE